MKKITKKLTCVLSLLALIGVTACGPTTSPTEAPTTQAPTTETPTTEAPSVPDGVLEGNPDRNYIYKLGDQIHDITLVDTNLDEHKLSKILESKKMVVVNFFASWCGPCAAEMPVMEEVYNQYKDDMEILALSCEVSDTLSLLDKNFVQRYSLTFPIGLDAMDRYNNFDNGGYVPLTAIVDRYGTIVEIHSSSIPLKSDWVKIVEKYIGDDYVQPEFDDDITISPDEPNEDVGPTKPDVEMPSSEAIEATINDDSYNFGYSNVTGDDAEYNWPWLISEEKNAIYPSNSEVEGSYSIINSTFTVTDIEKQVLAFDYITSTEEKYDCLYVLIDGVIVATLSGLNPDWQTCYAYVPLEAGTYQLSLAYRKDADTSVGDDIVYVRNMRFVSVNDIDVDMHIQRPAATGYDVATGKYTEYQTLVLNENDGYYHVNEANGPLILADLTRVTRWSNELTPYLIVANGNGVIDGVDYEQIVTDYASYSSNNSLTLTPVNEDLKEALVAITNKYGDDPSENQWQELCYYYSAYGPTAEELPSPITGLTMRDPILGETEKAIPVTFDTILVPRGKYIGFVAPETGAYRFTTDALSGTYGSVYNDEYEVIEVSTEYTHNKITTDFENENIEMYAYLEANQTYYFRIAYSIVEELGTFNAYINYVGETYEFLVLASDSTAFTTAGDEFDNIEDMEIISVNVDYEIIDGYYYHVREDGSIGSPIYADLVGMSSLFFLQEGRISIERLLELGGGVLTWYTDETETEVYEVIDVTEDLQKYIDLSKENTDGTTLIPVNEELASLLQHLMDYYTFYGVKDSWMKLCFYYDYFGPMSN